MILLFCFGILANSAPSIGSKHLVNYQKRMILIHNGSLTMQLEFTNLCLFLFGHERTAFQQSAFGRSTAGLQKDYPCPVS